MPDGDVAEQFQQQAAEYHARKQQPTTARVEPEKHETRALRVPQGEYRPRAAAGLVNSPDSEGPVEAGEPAPVHNAAVRRPPPPPPQYAASPRPVAQPAQAQPAAELDPAEVAKQIQQLALQRASSVPTFEQYYGDLQASNGGNHVPLDAARQGYTRVVGQIANDVKNLNTLHANVLEQDSNEANSFWGPVHRFSGAVSALLSPVTSVFNSYLGKRATDAAMITAVAARTEAEMPDAPLIEGGITITGTNSQQQDQGQVQGQKQGQKQDQTASAKADAEADATNTNNITNTNTNNNNTKPKNTN